MNLPHPVHGSAMRPGLSTAGSEAGSISRRRLSACGVSVCAVMSASTPERSRTTPLGSSIAGISAPLAPYRINFMGESPCECEWKSGKTVGLQIDRVERTGGANIEPVAFRAAEADVRDGFRNQHLADQAAVRRVDMHAVMRAAPQAPGGVDAEAVEQ